MTTTTTARTTSGRPPRPGKWRGPMREYDLAKEFVAALVVVALLTAVLAVIFSSPDEKNITLQDWAKAAPSDFVATASTELDGSSGSATYGPPYNSNGDGQAIGPLTLQKWAGVRIPIDPANDFVITPLSTLTADSTTAAAVSQWKSASADQQTSWASAYTAALAAAPDGDPAQVAAGDYGPVPQLTAALLGMADSGLLDSQLLDSNAGFFQTNYTKPLLFLADSTYLEDRAGAQHLQGGEWGMMNETGNYPGQAWLWLYTFWYQIKPFSVEGNVWGDNADAIIWGLMMLLSLVLALLPFIPGLRSIPRKIPIYRLIWRDYYRNYTEPPGRPAAAHSSADGGQAAG